MTPSYDFPTRLVLARAMIARGAPAPAVHLADQFAAADAEVREMADRLGTVLPILAPDRHWRQRVDARPSDLVRAYLLAGVLGCTTTCPHLRKGGPQPAFVQLPLRRVDCGRCVQTLRRPPPDESDRCDLCTTRGNTVFHPVAVRQGVALVVGDVCAACADVLGIVQKAEAS